MRSWWTKLALDKFEGRTKCFVQQYSSYALDGQNENGQRTLSNFISIISIFEKLCLSLRARTNSAKLRISKLVGVIREVIHRV